MARGKLKGIGGVLLAAGGGAASAAGAELAVSKIEFVQKNPYASPGGLIAVGALLGMSKKPTLRMLGMAAAVAGGVIGYQTFRMKQNAEQASGSQQGTSGVVQADDAAGVVSAPQLGTGALDDFDLTSDAGAVDYRQFAALGRYGSGGY